ncbi:MAG TPA: organomercurial lyase [bacterium]|nr:organomercurial lyase [bacterium]
MSGKPINVGQFAEEFAGAAPQFDAAGGRVAVALYRELAKGAAVPLARLAALLDVPPEAVASALSASTVFYDGSGAVTGFRGLALGEVSPHRLRVDGVTLYTWCAWDSLFIPGILGRTAEVVSRDPTAGAPISLRVGPDRVEHVDPAGTVLSFLAPERRLDRDVIRNFCHFVHFFGSAENGRTWTAAHPGTFLLSVEDAFALGRLTNARNFGGALGAITAS